MEILKRRIPLNIMMLKKNIFLIILFFSPTILIAENKLVIYTYESFSSEFGAGMPIKEIFEKKYDCKIEFIALADANVILTRLSLEQASSRADLIIGLDNLLLKKAENLELFSEHKLKLNLTNYNLKSAFNSKYFIPFDYGYLAFVYSKKKYPNLSPNFKQFIQNLSPDTLIAYQDPRTSSPGLSFVNWLAKSYPDDFDMLIKSLDQASLNYPASWSQAYQMFLNEDIDFVLSYITSPLYHLIVENDDSYGFYQPYEGNPLQVEYAGITKNSKNFYLAQKFLQFLISEEAQSILPETQWMFPIAKVNLRAEFKKLQNSLPQKVKIDYLTDYNPLLIQWQKSLN